MTTRWTAMILTALVGGCGWFHTGPDDDVALRPPGPPTTVPASDAVDYTSLSGASREIFIDLPTRLLQMLTDNTAADAVRRMEDSTSADRRRDGIANLADRDYGRGEPYTDRYRQIAQFDASPMVRSTAIRALNRSRDGAQNLFIAGLKDQDRGVRLESAKALSNIPSDDAAGALIPVLNNATEDIDVRIAAADALRHYDTPAVTAALIARLSDRDFGLAWQSRQSLRYLTGADLRFNATAWQSAVAAER